MLPALACDAVLPQPYAVPAELDLPGPLRVFNFLSVFKLEARKGWKELVRAWMEGFNENCDVALTAE